MPKILRYAQFRKEGTYGGVAEGDLLTEDIQSTTLDPPEEPHNVYEGGLGRVRRRVTPGYYHPEGNVVTGANITLLRHLFYWALAGGSASESFGDKEILLPSFKSKIGKDTYQHDFHGCVIDTLTLEIAETVAQVTVDIQAQKDDKSALQSQSSIVTALTGEPLLTFADMSVTADPERQIKNANIQSFNLAIANNLDVDRGRGQGSRFPHRIPGQERDTTVELTLFFENEEELERFWGNANGPQDGVGDFVELALVLTDADGDELAIDIPRLFNNGPRTQPSGKAPIEQTITGHAYEDDEYVEGAVTEGTDIHVVHTPFES